MSPGAIMSVNYNERNAGVAFAAFPPTWPWEELGQEGRKTCQLPAKEGKGTSNNPGGPPLVAPEVHELIKARTPRAFERIPELTESKDERVERPRSFALQRVCP